VNVRRNGNNQSGGSGKGKPVGNVNNGNGKSGSGGRGSRGSGNAPPAGTPVGGTAAPSPLMNGNNNSNKALIGNGNMPGGLTPLGTPEGNTGGALSPVGSSPGTPVQLSGRRYVVAPDSPNGAGGVTVANGIMNNTSGSPRANAATASYRAHRHSMDKGTAISTPTQGGTPITSPTNILRHNTNTNTSVPTSPTTPTVPSLALHHPNGTSFGTGLAGVTSSSGGPSSPPAFVPLSSATNQVVIPTASSPVAATVTIVPAASPLVGSIGVTKGGPTIHPSNGSNDGTVMLGPLAAASPSPASVSDSAL
jgi:hypothetical protein